MLKKYKKFIIVAVVVIILFFIYGQFFAGDGDGPALVSEGASGADSDVTRELLATLLEIRSITLDESIFNDPGFQAFVDFSQDVPPQAVGRPNPFSPIGSDPVEIEVEAEEDISEDDNDQ